MIVIESDKEKPLTTTDINLLYRIGELDTRTYNLCRTNSFRDLDELTEYYLEHGSFKQLRNCGVISDQLLMNLCERHFKSTRSIRYLEKDMLEYESFETARKDLENGYIDALVLVGRTNSFLEDSRTIKGKLGICHTHSLARK